MVCVVKGVCPLLFFVGGPQFEERGRACTPKSWAAGICVKNANGASPLVPPPVGDVSARNVRFDESDGWSSACSLWIWASFLIFSARSAAYNFCVSWSLRRSACNVSWVTFESGGGTVRFWYCISVAFPGTLICSRDVKVTYLIMP